MRWLSGAYLCFERLQNADGSFAEPVPGDASVTATAAFALLCAQADSLIWNNYALADVEPGM